MASFRVHRVGFYSLEPNAILAMDYSPTADLLALSRSDSSVEIWTVSHTPLLQRTIPPSPEGMASVEAVCWAGQRLFSCGLHGFVVEYDLNRLQVKGKHSVTSGPAWCLAADKMKTKLAVGSEEGLVCIFSILPDTLEYFKVLDKQQGRILCLSWHQDSALLATGSIDTIRVWNTVTGHPIARMTPGRTEKNKETVVWSLVFTPDMTIISGDSRGKTSFWDGNTGVLIESIQSHKADVLCVGLNSTGTEAYSSGIDPTIMHFQTIRKTDGRLKWVKSLHRVLNAHDVRCLVYLKDKLFIGGVDSYLTVSSYHARTVTKVPPIPSGRISSIAPEANVLLLRYSSHLELWSLGTTQHTTGMLNSVLPLDMVPENLLQLNTKDGERMVTSCVSRDATWLAFATATQLRLFQVRGCGRYSDQTSPSISRVRAITPEYINSHHLHFFQISGCQEYESHLFSATEEGGVQVFGVGDSDGLVLLHSLPPTQTHMTSAVHLVSIENQVAVISDYNGTVCCLDLCNGKVISKLPSYKEAPIATLSMSTGGETVVIVYTDQRVVECSVETGRFTQFSTNLERSLPRDWKHRHKAVRGVSFVPPKNDLLLLHDEEQLIILDREKAMPEPYEKLLITDPRWNSEDSRDDSLSTVSINSSDSNILDPTVALRILKKYSHLVSLHHLNNDLLVCVEVRPEAIEDKLPPSLQVKKYGAS